MATSSIAARGILKVTDYHTDTERAKAKLARHTVKFADPDQWDSFSVCSVGSDSEDSASAFESSENESVHFVPSSEYTIVRRRVDVDKEPTSPVYLPRTFVKKENDSYFIHTIDDNNSITQKEIKNITQDKNVAAIPHGDLLGNLRASDVKETQ